jgi:lipooligosaccharide transport system ATP-binding protein
MIRANSLVKCYGDKEVVKGIDFHIEKGEFFGFLGPNGAGKTTVMRMISCFMPPTGGSLSVLGMDVTEKPSEIKAQIGLVAQDNNLDPDNSVIENLIIYAYYYGIKKKDALPKAKWLLDFVDLADRANDPIQSLSGGMLRRLQIARSLVNSPQVLIMDEPTTGLDPHSRRVLWDKLANIRKESGVTMLLSTHYMQEAEELCTKVAVMDRGRIVTIDSPQNLMNQHGGTLEDAYLRLTGRPLDS